MEREGKYEHKTVGLNHFDAHRRQQGYYMASPNLGGDMQWHVVGVIQGGIGDPHSQTFS